MRNVHHESSVASVHTDSAHEGRSSTSGAAGLENPDLFERLYQLLSVVAVESVLEEGGGSKCRDKAMAPRAVDGTWSQKLKPVSDCNKFMLHHVTYEVRCLTHLWSVLDVFSDTS